MVALRPQLVRIFFNTSEWANEDRMDSFVRTVQLAERADAEINITWQGSTFEFAMRNMPRFADELAALVQLHGIERLWVTMFNEPNTTGRTLAEYEQVYRSLHRLLVERGVRDRIRFMGGDLTRSEQGPSQAEWLRYMASHMGDLLDAWSVHVYWNFWDTDKIDDRLLRRSAKHRELHSGRAAPPRVRHGVRRPRTRDVRGRSELRSWLLARRHRYVGHGAERVPACLVQHPRRAARLLGHGQVGRVPGQVRRGHTGLLRRSARVPRVGRRDPSTTSSNCSLGRPSRAAGTSSEVTAGPSADRRKLVTAYVSPANDITILGLHKAGGAIPTTSNAPVTYTLGGLPANATFRLLVWNGDGSGTNVDAGFFATDADGAIEISIPRDAVFALTTTPIMTVPW